MKGKKLNRKYERGLYKIEEEGMSRNSSIVHQRNRTQQIRRKDQGTSLSKQVDDSFNNTIMIVRAEREPRTASIEAIGSTKVRSSVN